jgi:hypothetical protein
LVSDQPHSLTASPPCAVTDTESKLPVKRKLNRETTDRGFARSILIRYVLVALHQAVVESRTPRAGRI